MSKNNNSDQNKQLLDLEIDEIDLEIDEKRDEEIKDDRPPHHGG
jgi:hypothetical protein